MDKNDLIVEIYNQLDYLKGITFNLPIEINNSSVNKIDIEGNMFIDNINSGNINQLGIDDLLYIIDEIAEQIAINSETF